MLLVKDTNLLNLSLRGNTSSPVVIFLCEIQSRFGTVSSFVPWLLLVDFQIMKAELLGMCNPQKNTMIYTKGIDHFWGIRFRWTRRFGTGFQSRTEIMLMRMSAHYPLYTSSTHIQSTYLPEKSPVKCRIVPLSHKRHTSTTAAYLYVPYACRQREIRAPSTAQPRAWIAITPKPNVTMATSHYTL